MTLIKTYSKVKPSIVAFCVKHGGPNDPDYGAPGRLPHILGTGFIFDSSGLILTNQHVVDLFRKFQKEDDKPFGGIVALLFDQEGEKFSLISLEILNVTSRTEHIPRHSLLDRFPPDIAVVGVNLYGLPSCQVRSTTGGIEEGLEIATAGFPMGRNWLVASDGKVEQLSPFLQSGIVSALQPFASPAPANFTINILIQGGASGSPVFDVETGEVLGVAFARIIEPVNVPLRNSKGDLVKDGEGNQLLSSIALPSNFSRVVPMYLLSYDLPKLAEAFALDFKDKQISLDEFKKKTKPLII